MVTANKYGPTHLSTKVNGPTIKQMDLENLSMLMVMYTKDNGKMIKLTE